MKDFDRKNEFFDKINTLNSSKRNFVLILTKKLVILVTFYCIHQKLLKVIKIRNPSLFMFSPRWEKIKVIIKFAFRPKVEHLKRPAVQSSSQQRSAAIFPGRLLKQQSHKRASFWLRWCRLRVPPSIHRFFFSARIIYQFVWYFLYFNFSISRMRA